LNPFLRNGARYAGAILVIGIGLARGIGGVLLSLGDAAVHSTAATRATGIVLLAVSLLGVAGGLLVIAKRSQARAICVAFLVLYPIDGALNGLVLFGHVPALDTVINLSVVVVSALLLWAGGVFNRGIP
jgi:hypothetical protein